MNEGGLDLEELGMQLQRKVEELTLYTLAQQDTIETQQAAIEALEAHLGEVTVTEPVTSAD